MLFMFIWGTIWVTCGFLSGRAYGYEIGYCEGFNGAIKNNHVLEKFK